MRRFTLVPTCAGLLANLLPPRTTPLQLLPVARSGIKVFPTDYWPTVLNLTAKDTPEEGPKRSSTMVVDATLLMHFHNPRRDRPVFAGQPRQRRRKV
jgi:hypothetical protein